MSDGVDGETPVERVVETASQWPEVTLGPHSYDGVEFLLDDYEIGHAHYGWESVHVNYPRRMRDALIEEGRTSRHPYFSDSGWTSYDVRTPGDVAGGLWLLRVAYLYRASAQRQNPAAREVTESVDVAAELDELDVSDRVRDLFDDVVELHA